MVSAFIVVHFDIVVSPVSGGAQIRQRIRARRQNALVGVVRRLLFVFLWVELLFVRLLSSEVFQRGVAGGSSDVFAELLVALRVDPVGLNQAHLLLDPILRNHHPLHLILQVHLPRRSHGNHPKIAQLLPVPSLQPLQTRILLASLGLEPLSRIIISSDSLILFHL